MTTRFLVFLLMVSGWSAVTPLAAQPAVSEAGLAAEGERRWDDAVAIYQRDLAREPGRVDLWVRIADIEAGRGNLAAAIDALERAAHVTPSDATVHARLSQAYAAANQPRLALDAIEVAVALAPDNGSYLEARGTVATWSGYYGRAQNSYRRLLHLQPDAVTALKLARVSAWSGDTNEACSMYRSYLAKHPDDASVWIELARTESWRGNYAAALDALAAYRARLGDTSEYGTELAAVLARAGRPTRAIDLVRPLLEQHPDHQGLHMTRTIARAMQRRTREALAGLASMTEKWPDALETESTRRWINATLSSTVTPELRFYHDSDGLDVLTFDPKLSVALANGTTLGAGYQHDELRAPSGSGLEPIAGALSTHHQLAWVSAARRVNRVGVLAQAGLATLAERERFTYAVGLDVRAHDALTVAVKRSTGFLTVSPRTVGLGLRLTDNRTEVDWMPGIQYHVVADGRYQNLSDGNRRWDLAISPRRSVARTERVNLDLGVSAYFLGVANDLNNGYYDPRFYEQYAGVIYPYWKIDEDVGLGASIALGVQRDTRPGPFRFGGNASAEVTIGIYDPWMLKIGGSVTNNRRLDADAFRGFSGSVGLTRRF